MSNKCEKTETYKLTIQNFSSEKYERHSSGVYLHPSVKDELDKPIYRYMRLEYLLKMLFSKKLYMANRQNFPDLVEKGYKSNLKNLFPLSPIGKTKKEKKDLCLRSKAIDDGIYKSCISCWTYDEHYYSSIKSDENYLMWKAYVCQDVGCRIETTLRDLIENIVVPARYDILISKVDYRTDEWLKGNPQKDIFAKSIYYRGEQELRICVLCQDEQILLDIDPLAVIKKVLLSPFINKEFASFIIRQFENEYPQIPIEKSRIAECDR